MGTDIFKLIFEHDLRLEQLSDEFDVRGDLKRPSTLEEFMKPVQTYSSFYFSGTVLPEMRFGINTLLHFDGFVNAFDFALGKKPCVDASGNEMPVSDFLNTGDAGKTAIIPTEKKPYPQADVKLFDPSLHVREKIPFLRPVLDDGHLVLFTEKAHHGFDLFLFSRANIYEQFFKAFKPMISPGFRFFSINGKRAKSERLFYFETWSLDRPPHGFEEVFEQTVLR